MSLLTDEIIERLKDLRDQTRYYGLGMGGTLVSIELVQYLHHDNITVSSAFIFLFFKIATLLFVTYKLTLKLKDEFFKTGMTYFQSLSIGFRLFLYGSMIVGIFSFILNKWIAPEYISEMLNNSTTTLQSYTEKAELTAEQGEYVNEFIEQLEGAETPTTLSSMWGLMWSYLFWGACIAAIISIFTRDKNATPFGQQQDADNLNK